LVPASKLKTVKILTSVIGYTELALDDAEKGTLQHENLHEILKTGNRATDLVKQILIHINVNHAAE
jgi:hypothetical protein